MSVDFKPELGALKSLRPFVFWAQTTLPTVFDDSLSYYEVLTKLTKMVNTLLENTDTTEANVEALATAYDELQTYVNDYFENLDVTTEIDNKLEEWRSDGIIDDMVDSYVAPIIHDYLYGADDEGGVQKTLEDMLADATESLNNALSTFSSDSRQALNDFERDSRDALTDFEDATDDALDAIPTTVDAWLVQNFTNPSSPPLDATLSLGNAAAQSKATGERCDQLEDLVLSNNDWINSVSEVESNQYVVVNNDGTNPRIANDASSDPLRPMSVANITGGRSYLISCVGNTVGPNTFSPAYAICNLSYDLQDEPVYTILDFYPRAWDPQVNTYEIIRSKSVYIPETIGLQTVNCLILMGNTDITVTPKCGVLSVKTDNTLTDPLLPANSKAVGDALANKLPWPVTEGQKDLGTNGKALLSNGDGTTRWGDTGGDYDQEIAELQGDVSELMDSLNDLEYTMKIPFSESEGYINTSGTIGSVVNTTPVTGSGFNYIIYPCKKGDVFTLTAKGGGTPRVWAFTDSDYILLSKSAPSVTVTDLELTAEHSGYFIANNTQAYSNPSCTVKTVLTADVVEEIANDTVENVIADYSKINDIFNGFPLAPNDWGVGSYTQTIGSESVIFATNARRHTPVITKTFPVYISSDGTYKYNVLYLDSAGILLSKYTELDGLFVVPSNTNFRVIIQDASDSTTDISAVPSETINSKVKIYNNDLSDLLNPAVPVKWCAMGDSITYGYYSYIDDNDVGTYGIDSINTWAPRVSRINKWDLANIAIGGTGFLKPFNNAEDDHSTGYYVARNTDYSSYDLVTLAYGINDWKANLQIGSLSDDASAVTPTTVIQAMKATIEAIMASNPNCKIIGILPLNCVGYDKNYGTKATNWGLGYAFPNSGTLEQFVTTLISVYNYYGIQYIDMTHYSCVNRDNLLTALPDGVHPSLVTHNLMAHELSKKITF